MSTNEGVQEKSGLSRRDLIKKGAVAGAIVWTIPMIASVPAYASVGSPGGITACSFVTIVYTYTVTNADGSTNVLGPVANKFDSTGCHPNGTNNFGFCYQCGSTTYDNGGSDRKVRSTDTSSSTPTPTDVPDGPCPSPYFYFSGGQVIPMPGVTILFVVAHNGNFNWSSTGATTPYTTIDASTGLCNTSSTDSVYQVACGPITNSTSPVIKFGCC